MNELRDFYYLDSRLCKIYLAQIEDGLIQYKYEQIGEGDPKHTFEISTKALSVLLETTLGIPMPDMSYRREGKDKKIQIEEYKTHDNISQFTRLLKYLEPALIIVNEKQDSEFWKNLNINQLLKFKCRINISNLYLFSEFSRRLGQDSIFSSKNNHKLDEYVKHAEIINSKNTHNIILRPDYAPDDSKYFFVSGINKKNLDEDIELINLNNDNFNAIGRVDKIFTASEKEIIFDLTETGMLEVMRSKDIKEFLKRYNEKMMPKFKASEQDVYVTKPAIKLKLLALYKA